MLNRIPPHPVSHGVREADARRNGTDVRHQADVIEEYQASLQRAVTEVLGPDWALVSVKEVEDIVYEIEEEPARVARRIAVMRRQLKRSADLLQGMADYDQLRADVERMRENVNHLMAHCEV